jgi:hypothetical protein
LITLRCDPSRKVFGIPAIEFLYALTDQFLTLKAFANSSPGLRPATLGHRSQQKLFATLKRFPGFQSKPWAEIRQRFQRYPRRKDIRLCGKPRELDHRSYRFVYQRP